MSRFICGIIALILSAAVLAAPAPKSKPFVSGWEDPVDPDRDCKISREKNVLTIEMPGTLHSFDPLSKRFNAPRLLREIDGDFVMQIRLRFACRPSVRSLDKEMHPFIAAGFLVILPENFPTKCCRMEYRLAGFGLSPNGYVAAEVWDNQGKQEKIVGDENWSFQKPEHVYLRLERSSERLRYSISPDGKVWMPRGGGPIKGLPSKLKLGLAAHSNSAEPSKVLFDQFTLQRGKKKSK